jgi:hypothetical protein
VQGHSSDERADRIEAKLDALSQSVDQRFQGVDQRLKGIDQRFAQIDQRFEQVDRRFEKVDQQFDAMRREFKIEQQHTRDLFNRALEGITATLTRMERSHLDWRREVWDALAVHDLALRDHARRIGALEQRDQ